MACVNLETALLIMLTKNFNNFVFKWLRVFPEWTAKVCTVE